MANPDEIIRIRYEADIAKLRQQLAEIPDLTSDAAKKAAKEIERMTKELEKMAKEAEKAGKKAGDAMDDVSESGKKLHGVGSSIALQLPDVWTQLEMGTDPMRVLTQQGLQVLQVHMTEFLKLAKTVGVFMAGPWGIAIGAGAAIAVGAIYAVRKEAEITALETETLGGTLNGVSIELLKIGDDGGVAAGGLEKMREQVRKAALEIEILTGQTTKYDAARRRANDEIAQGSLASIQEAAAAQTAAELKLQKLKDEGSKQGVAIRQKEFSHMENGVAVYKEAWTETTSALIDAAQTEVDLAKEKFNALRDERKEGQAIVTVALELAEAERLGAIYQKDKAKRDRESALALRKEEQERLKAAAALLAATETIQSISSKARADELTANDLVLANMQAQLDVLDEIEAKYETLPGLADARLEVEARASRELTKIRNEEAEKQLKLDQTVTDAKISLAQSSLSAVETFARIGAQSEGEYAMLSFRIAQASAGTQVAINTIVAASRAIAELGPIAGPIAAVGIGIGGAAQEAAVWSQSPPSFYPGGFTPSKVSTDAIPTITHPDEAILNKTGRKTIGDEAIRKANRGQSQGQPSMAFRVDGREFGTIAAHQARRGGRLSDELTRRSGRLGRRAR